MSNDQMHNLAVMFRVNDPNLGHVSTFEAMTEIGLAYLFGHFMGIPKRHWRKRLRLANNIATEIEKKATVEAYKTSLDALMR